MRVARCERLVHEPVKTRHVVRRNEGGQPAARELEPIGRQQPRARQVRGHDRAVAVERDVRDRRQVEQLGVRVARRLQLALNVAQLFVLQLELDLVAAKLRDHRDEIAAHSAGVAGRHFASLGPPAEAPMPTIGNPRCSLSSSGATWIVSAKE
jgi:hypothetical protein